MDIKFQINLQQMAVIAVADSIWSQDEEVLDFTKTYLCSSLNKGKPEVWDAIVKVAVKKVDQKSMPEDLYAEVCHVVHHIGIKQRDWFTYLRSHSTFLDIPRHILYKHYMKKIYWTYYGTIDEEKIIKSWFHDPNCDLWKIYIMACCFCSGELIREIWTEVNKKYCPDDFQKLGRHLSSVLAAFWNRRFNNNLGNFLEDIKKKLGPHYIADLICNEDDSVIINMFRLAVSKGYKAAKYIWLELTEEEKNENTQTILRKILNFGCYSLIGYSYRCDLWTEILVSCGLLNHNVLWLAFNKENKFYEAFDRVIEYLTKWPWVDLLVPFIFNTERFLDEKIYSKLFSTVVHKINKDQARKNSLFQKKFYQLWRIAPVNYKNTLSAQIVCGLFDAWDVKNLKLVLNDKTLIHKREKFIKQGYFKYRSFLSEMNIKMLTEFLLEIALLKVEDKIIILNLKEIYLCLLNSEFDSAMAHLDSFCDSDKLKIDLKKDIDEYIMCTFFIACKRFDLADKFLYWKFESNDVVIGYKYFLLFDDFFQDHIYDLWVNSDTEVAKIQCTNFFAWFSFTCEELKMRIIKLLTIENIPGKQCFLEDLNFNDHYDKIYDFLIWCEVDEEGIRSIKEKLLPGDSVRYVLERCMRENDINLFEKLFKGESENEKNMYLKNFLISRGCVYACRIFVGKTCAATMWEPDKPSKENILKELKEFIKFWMKPLENFDSFKTVFNEWPFVLGFGRESGDSGSDSDGTLGGRESDEERTYANLEKENYDLFMDLLKSFIDNGNTFTD